MSVQARADAGLKTSPSAAFLRQQQQPPPLFSGATAAEVDSVAGGGFALQQEPPIRSARRRERIRRGNDNVMKNAEIDAKLVKNVRNSPCTPAVSAGTVRPAYCLLD
jgi:hypothetical protein